MPLRPLTERQKRALMMMPSVYLWTEGSLPSLAKRGLVERFAYVEHGRRYFDWRLTDAGRAEAKRLRAEWLAARQERGEMVPSDG